jgi:hypothetical protein
MSKQKIQSKFVHKDKAIKLSPQELEKCIEVRVGLDGVWVTFKSESGNSFAWQPATEWEQYSFWRPYMAGWCNEIQVKHHPETIHGRMNKDFSITPKGDERKRD